MFVHSSQSLKENCLYIVNTQLKTFSGENIRMTPYFLHGLVIFKENIFILNFFSSMYHISTYIIIKTISVALFLFIYLKLINVYNLLCFFQSSIFFKVYVLLNE